VKHLGEQHRKYFDDLLGEAGLSVPGEVRDVILRHIDWVLDRNPSVNLTAITDPIAAVRLHGVDSLMALGEVLSAPHGALLDLGTGAGFPGVPLAAASGRRTLLVDSTAKKCGIVAEFLSLERLLERVSVECGRAETVAEANRERFAVVTARAVAPLASLVELAAPFLADGGVFLALKGQLERSEVERGDQAAQLIGLSKGVAREARLPDGGETRNIVQYTRVGKPQVQLPRRIGVAQKRPLA